MLKGRIDISRLQGDIASLALQSLELKASLRRTWERPMADEQRTLVYLRRQATDLHVLLARARGRWHVISPPQGAPPDWDKATWNQRIAERTALDYAAPETATLALAP